MKVSLLYTLQTLFPNIAFLPKRVMPARGCAVVMKLMTPAAVRGKRSDIWEIQCSEE